MLNPTLLAGVKGNSSGTPVYFNGGTPITAAGELAYDTAGAVATVLGGLPYTAAGALAATDGGTPATVAVGGLPLTAAGRVAVAVGGTAVGVLCGLPVDAQGRPCITLAAPAGDPYWANVVQLCSFEGASLNTGPWTNKAAPRGNALAGTNLGGGALGRLITTDKYFGTSCVECPNGGAGNGPNSLADYTFGTGDFTIEGFCKNTGGYAANNCIFDMRPSGEGLYPCLRVTSTGVVQWWINGAAKVASAAGVWTGSAWRWFAVSRAAGTTYILLDGVVVASVADVVNYATQGLWFGDTRWGAQNFYGLYDEVRVTKGTGRYTGNTPIPTAPYPTSTLRATPEVATVQPEHVKRTTTLKLKRPRK